MTSRLFVFKLTAVLLGLPVSLSLYLVLTLSYYLTSPSRIPFLQNTHTLTDVSHLGHRGSEGAIGEGRGIVVHILNLDDELRLGLHSVMRDAVDGTCMENIAVLLLTVQALGGMNVSGRLINGEDGASSFS